MRKTGGTVYSGPFRGMQYATAGDNVYYSRLLGTYEQELHPVIEQIIALQPDSIIDVGAAEGYYAVGLAIRLPASSIIAFEASAEERERLGQLCRRNNVDDRVKILGWCNPDGLSSVLPDNGRTVVICDVEGYEKELFNSTVASALKNAYLLVELHEFASPGVANSLTEKFSATHVCERIWQRGRTRDDLPFNNLLTFVLPHAYATYQVQEFRPEIMSWFWMTPQEAKQ
jgi:hypothetical protein